MKVPLEITFEEFIQGLKKMDSKWNSNFATFEMYDCGDYTARFEDGSHENYHAIRITRRADVATPYEETMWNPKKKKITTCYYDRKRRFCGEL